jgi:MFS family permease
MPPTLRSARLSVAATFAVHAIVSGTWAPRIPTIKSNLELDAGELGIALTGVAIGLLAGTRIVGRAVDRFGTRLPIRLGLPVLCVALVGPALAPNLVALTGAFVFLGLASGFLDVAMNANAVAVERGYRRPIMSGLHGLWSVGLLAGSAVGTGAAALGAGVVLHFSLAAAGLVVLAVVATRGLLSTAPPPVARQAAGPVLPTWGAWSTPALLLGLIAFSSFVGEGAAADWSAVYMHERIGTGTGAAGIAFVAFSAGMIASRFVGDPLSARIGPAAVARGGALVAAAGLTVALGVPHPATVTAGYLLFGLGVGPIVPITFSAAGNVDHTRSGTILGSVVTIGYVGSVVGPIVIGFTADSVGLRAALVFPILLAVLAAALSSSVASAAGGETPIVVGH